MEWTMAAADVRQSNERYYSTIPYTYSVVSIVSGGLGATNLKLMAPHTSSQIHHNSHQQRRADCIATIVDDGAVLQQPNLSSCHELNDRIEGKGSGQWFDDENGLVVTLRFFFY